MAASSAKLEEEVRLLRRQVESLQAQCASLQANATSRTSPPPLDATASPQGLASLQGTSSPAFQQEAAALFDAHMGVENMGPLLYNLVRFAKPQRLIEVGAGYTSLWLLQALKDNSEELSSLRGKESPVPGVPWFVESAFEATLPLLHCVDNMEHESTTAHRVAAAAETLGLTQHLVMHVADAFEALDTTLGGLRWDFMWFDGISAHPAWPRFFRGAWQRLGDRGLALVHSSLTNATTRGWLAKALEEAAVKGPWVSLELELDGEPEKVLERLTEALSEQPAWRQEAKEKLLFLRVALQPGESAFEAGLALADDLAALEGVKAVGKVLPAEGGFAGMQHVGLLEPHKRMQNSVSLLQKRTAGGGLSEPTYTYLP